MPNKYKRALDKAKAALLDSCPRHNKAYLTAIRSQQAAVTAANEVLNHLPDSSCHYAEVSVINDVFTLKLSIYVISLERYVYIDIELGRYVFSPTK